MNIGQNALISHVNGKKENTKTLLRLVTKSLLSASVDVGFPSIVIGIDDGATHSSISSIPVDSIIDGILCVFGGLVC